MNVAETISSLRQLPPEQALARASKVLPPWVVLALVLALAWKASQLTWLLWPGGLDVAPASIPAGDPTTQRREAAPSRGLDVQGIVAAHLFGEPPAAGPVQPVDQLPEDIPEDRGNLTLSGTIAADDPVDARAIIRDSGGEESALLGPDPMHSITWFLR